MRPLDSIARRGLWALPLWAVLLFSATLTHQPPYQTEFAAWSRYVTQPQFLVSHLVGSILGACIGIIGFTVLTYVLAELGVPRLAVWGLVTSVFGAVLTTAVFGIAAFAQPAIGRSFLAGHSDMVDLYNDVNGVPLFGTALPGVLLLSAGMIIYGVAVARSQLAPTFAALAVAVGGPLFAILGVALADVVQSVGAALLVLGTVTIAWYGRQYPYEDPATSTSAWSA